MATGGPGRHGGGGNQGGGDDWNNWNRKGKANPEGYRRGNRGGGEDCNRPQRGSPRHGDGNRDGNQYSHHQGAGGDYSHTQRARQGYGDGNRRDGGGGGSLNRTHGPGPLHRNTPTGGYQVASREPHGRTGSWSSGQPLQSIQPLNMPSSYTPPPTQPQRESAPERSTPFPDKPAPGPFDGTIALVANHFAVAVRSGQVYHYDVKVLSVRRAQAAEGPAVGAAEGPAHQLVPCLIARINRHVFAELMKTNPDSFDGLKPVFDGRQNLYTRKKLKSDTNHFDVSLPVDGSQRQFRVNIHLVAELNLDTLHALYDGRTGAVPQNVIQALDIVMRHGPCITFTPVGRSFFAQTAETAGVSLSAVVELKFGYYASVRPAQRTLMLNVDRSAMAFYKFTPVVTFMTALLQERQTPYYLEDLTAEQLALLSHELRNVRVRGTHFPRQYKVAEVTRQPAHAITFERRANGVTEVVSVAQYFRDRYPKKRLNPNLPCLRVGSLDRPVYLPIEVCEIVDGQPYRRKLSPSMTKTMITKTAQAPHDRFREIQTSFQKLHGCSRTYLEEFGITVDNAPTKLMGRRLHAPRLAFSGNAVQEPSDGVWDTRSRHLLVAKPMNNWVLLKCDCTADLNTHPLISTFQNVGKSLGMKVDFPLTQAVAEGTPASITATLNRLKAQHSGLNLVVVLLGETAPYAVIKEVAEVTLGIRTQCIQAATVTGKWSASIGRNLCLKINAKLGGANNGLMGTDRPESFSDTLIIGADVTHPAPGDRFKPSIAACVGSMDGVPGQYRASIRVQTQRAEAVARVEIIENIKDMVSELLQAFIKKNRKRPKRVIFYRDGVSEGQFRSVLQHELREITSACSMLEGGSRTHPPITFIVVQKRHHTRFKPVNDRDRVGKPGNIPPGTVVDSVVTHPVDSDFFLCSHLGIQGTSRPSRYVVLHDESNFSPDYLQKLSYQLCHTYARCTRSVSIPAPVYYAHLAAFRAKDHIAGACALALGAPDYEKAVAVTEQMKDVMYFV